MTFHFYAFWWFASHEKLRSVKFLKSPACHYTQLALLLYIVILYYWGEPEWALTWLVLWQNHLYPHVYVWTCMCVAIRRPHVRHTRASDAETSLTVLGKGRRPRVNSKCCSSKNNFNTKAPRGGWTGSHVLKSGLWLSIQKSYTFKSMIRWH